MKTKKMKPEFDLSGQELCASDLLTCGRFLAVARGRYVYLTHWQVCFADGLPTLDVWEFPNARYAKNAIWSGKRVFGAPYISPIGEFSKFCWKYGFKVLEVK